VLDKRGELADATAAAIKDAGGEALGLNCDVGNEPPVESAIASAARAFGGLDAVFANAGTAGAGWIHETPLEAWERVIRVNLTGVFLTAKHAIPYLLEAGGGAIVTTGSIASVVVGAGGSAASYAASKGGVLQFTRQIAVDYGRRGIRANCLCPGAVASDLGVHVREDREGSEPVPTEPLPRPRGWTPLARVADPAEMAGVVAFLLSDDASFVSGSAVFADGGYTSI
jgi:NAD(P)-dependent dehydrogenase (short-subunit alcohol dehydrogenase family)